MKTAIQSNTRAAFYFKLRNRGGYNAAQAWQYSLNALENWRAKEAARDATRAALAGLWESLGREEPKRYGPEGTALAAARSAATKAATAMAEAAAHYYPGSRGYVGTWQSESGLFYCANPDLTFRNAQAAGGIRSHSYRLDIPGGYYCDEYRDSLCVPYVAQLAGRDGRAFYVAGYQFSATDSGGVTFDLSRRFSAPGDDFETGLVMAARAADSMAEAAANKEREYQAAWAAGSSWAELKETEGHARKEALAILKERRAVKGLGQSVPAICAALRVKVESLLETIQESRKERESLWTDTRGQELEAAFLEGAGLSEYPN